MFEGTSSRFKQSVTPCKHPITTNINQLPFLRCCWWTLRRPCLNTDLNIWAASVVLNWFHLRSGGQKCLSSNCKQKGPWRQTLLLISPWNWSAPNHVSDETWRRILFCFAYSSIVSIVNWTDFWELLTVGHIYLCSETFNGSSRIHSNIQMFY